MVQKYNIKIKVESNSKNADDSNLYFHIIKTLRTQLKGFKDYSIEQKRPYIIIKEIGKEGLNKGGVLDYLDLLIQSKTSKRSDVKKISLEDITEDSKLQVELSPTNRALVESVSEFQTGLEGRIKDYEMKIKNYQTSEEGFIAEIEHGEKLLNEEIKRRENIQEDYNKLEEKYSKLEKEFKTYKAKKVDNEGLNDQVKELKLKLRKIGLISESGFKGLSKLKRGENKEKYVIEAIEHQCKTLPEIKSYLNRLSLEISEPSLYIALSNLSNQGKIKRESRGKYQPL